MRHFLNKLEQLLSLLKKVKFQAFWWLKPYYVIVKSFIMFPSCNVILFLLATLW